MRRVQLLLSLAAAAVLPFIAAAVPAAVPRPDVFAITRRQNGTSSCSSPEMRKEWRQLSDDEHSQYISAVRCLAGRESTLVPGTTRLDDFARVHAAVYDKIHQVASFLPWHRYYLHLYVLALQTECTFSGPLPFWDWTLDAAAPTSAPVWDPTTGFGGNGVADPDAGGRTCIADGPFTSLRPTFYNSATERTPHCLARSFNDGAGSTGPMLRDMYTPDAVAAVVALEGFDDFRTRLELGPHGAVHNSIGGDMMASTSSNDPIFFLHHAQIDRLWTLWQQASPDARTYDYAGDRDRDPSDGSAVAQASLDDVMAMDGLGADLAVRDVMSTQAGIFCYNY